MEYGIVYLLTNPVMPGLVNRRCEERFRYKTNVIY